MATISWTEGGAVRTARWHSESAGPAPGHVIVADDRMPADTAYRLVRGGTALLWRGGYPQARQLLRALGRRAGRIVTPGAFPAYRREKARRADLLGRLIVLLDAGHGLDLRRAPDVRQACTEAYGPPGAPRAVALTELLGVIGAHEWRAAGVPVSALDARIHPHYGVFSPVRGEHVDLVAQAPLPDDRPRVAFDLGTGTGVLAAVLARRGVPRIVATDRSPRALACARDNVARLGLRGRVDVAGPALYPEGRAGLVVCNPPWLPGRARTELEHGVYDPDGAMLGGFLTGLAAHLEPDGEGWLILSDLAVRLGLRGAGELEERAGGAGLRVVDRLDTRPRHRRARDETDPLYRARAGEITSLWRLSPVK